MRVRIWRILGVVVLGGGLVAGCNGPETRPAVGVGAGAFRAEKVQLQRSFTRIVAGELEGGEPTGIEAYVQLQDQFGDPIKAVGQFRFEVFRYKPAVSDPRGRRFEGEGMQLIDLREPQVNQQHWDDITQGYRMKLKLPPEAAAARQIVLQATFIIGPENRIQDMLVLERE